MPTRTTASVTTTRVTHLAKPMGVARESGPHLKDLREFVDACDGLPEGIFVRIEKGHMGESGRYDVTIEAIDQYPTPGVTPCH